ncbi:MAG: NADP-dependent oxidoreductase [Vulcanimicrobiaceae bacterium]
MRLASRPAGAPTDATFSFATVRVDPPAKGEIVVRNTLMSVDPYMRGRMNAGRSYAKPYEVGEVMYGGAIGTVVASAAPEISDGATVLHGLGWREYARMPAHHARVIDTSQVSAEAYLGALGMPGITAWVGLRIIAEVKSGETIFVSGAAGAVGSSVVQLAKHDGLRVVGSAGTAEKVRYLREELDADAAFNYHDGSVSDLLAKAAPDGIDVFFDNVGGEHLEAALGATKDFARLVICGAVSVYNAANPPPGPANIRLAIPRRLRITGFIVTDHAAREGEFIGEMLPLIAAGKVKARTTVVEGLDAAPGALVSILEPDAHIGKMLVRL